MRKPLLILLLIPALYFGQTNTPVPVPPAPAPAPAEDFGTTQNNISGAQSRSFGGGSLVKPNPILTSADFGFIQNPTFESGWRYGTGIGWSRINNGKGFGINAVLTFDLTQQTYSFYYRKNKWYYHFNLGRMGMIFNTGVSATRIWEPKKIKKLTLGIQMGLSGVSGGYTWFRAAEKDSKDAYLISLPYVVLIAQKEFVITKKIDWRPEAFITLGSPYYDIDNNLFDKSNTFNAVVGNNISYRLHKKFKLNVNWRMNMNTTPKWGVMNNILIGTNLGF